MVNRRISDTARKTLSLRLTPEVYEGIARPAKKDRARSDTSAA